MGFFLSTGIEAAICIVGGIYMYVNFSKGKCKSRAQLTGKTAIVTGSNTGIGLYTALDLAARNGRVILACRNLKKAEVARSKIVKETGNFNVVVKYLDVSNMESVKKFAEEIIQEEERLDILINNAGIAPWNREMSVEGIEMTFATNVLGPFLLSNLLVDLMKKSAPSRIVNISSNANSMGKVDCDNLRGDQKFTKMQYHDSKLVFLLCTNELARRLKNTGVTVNSLHPGTVRTEVFRHMPLFIQGFINTIGYILTKSPKEGAETTIHCAVCRGAEGLTGKYFMDCQVYDNSRWVSKDAYNEGLAKKVFEICERITNYKLSS